MEWMETITIIGTMSGLVITAMLVLRGDIKKTEQLVRSEVATLRGEIRQSEERTIGMIQQSEERMIGMIQEGEKRMMEMMKQGEVRTCRTIQESEKRQDVLRKAELAPINAQLKPISEQVYNHIPTQIDGLQTIILKHIVNGAVEGKNTAPPQENGGKPTQPDE